jgi:hypothetical protein
VVFSRAPMADDEQPKRTEGAMKYDLLLTGGDVLDPAGGLRGLMDIGIAGGKISAVAPSLPAADARRTISAKGWLVTPGLVDIHAHIFVNASDMAGHTDHFCRASGVTTLCDAGSTGSATFPGLRQVIDREVRTRTRAFVNLSAIGILPPSLYTTIDLAFIVPRFLELTLQCVARLGSSRKKVEQFAPVTADERVLGHLLAAGRQRCCNPGRTALGCGV